MHSTMMDMPLSVSSVIEYAAREFPWQEIVSRNSDGSIFRYSYGEARDRSRKLARALINLGIEEGDRVATMAWNNYRHVELYYGISGIGAVCHTVNPRLHPDQIEYIVNHSEARILFFEVEMAGVIEQLLDKLPKVEKFYALLPREPVA